MTNIVEFELLPGPNGICFTRNSSAIFIIGHSRAELVSVLESNHPPIISFNFRPGKTDHGEFGLRVSPMEIPIATDPCSPPPVRESLNSAVTSALPVAAQQNDVARLAEEKTLTRGNGRGCVMGG